MTRNRQASWSRYEERHAAEKADALARGCVCAWRGNLRVAGTSAGCPNHDPRLDPRFAPERERTS